MRTAWAASWSSPPCRCWSSTRGTSTASRALSTRSWPTSNCPSKRLTRRRSDGLGEAERVPGTVVPVSAAPPAGAGPLGPRVHRRRPVHLGRAGGVHEALDLGRRSLALLLRPPDTLRLLPRHHARGGPAPAPSRGDDGGDRAPGTELQGPPRAALRPRAGAGAPCRGGCCRCHALGRAG